MLGSIMMMVVTGGAGTSGWPGCRAYLSLLSVRT